MERILNLAPCSYHLNDFDVIELVGEDATRYLHSQTTNNVIDLAKKEVGLNALVDLSGKLISYFFVVKLSDHSLKLIVPREISNQTIERIEKFHITEEFETKRSNETAYIYLNQKSSYEGTICGITIGFDFKANSEELLTENEFEDFCHLIGLPVLNKTISVNELINNTLLNNTAIDYKKGCYPGQETVAKIESRRGAAFAPVYLVGSADLPEAILLADKKIGTKKASIQYENKSYHLCSLNRNFQVVNKEVLINNNIFKTASVPLLTNEFIAERLYNEAVILFQKNKEDIAVDYLLRIIRNYPEFSDAYESLGVIYGRQERFQEAIEIMHKLESIDEKSVMAQTNLSMFYMKIGEIEKAEKHKSEATFKQFLVLGDEASSKKEEEEKQKKQKEELARREQMFMQVLEIDEKDPLAAFGLGTIRYDEGSFLEAKKLLEYAIESDSKYSVAYLALAKVYKSIDDKESLKKVLETGIKVASSNGDLMPANEMQSMLVSL